MAADLSKLLVKIAEDNHALKASHAALGRAFDRLDQRLNQLKAGRRIELYAVGKGASASFIGLKRYHDGWRITTQIEGIGDTTAEAPAVEAVPEIQVVLIDHVGDLLGKISDGIAKNLKAATAASVQADKLVAAIRGEA